MFCNGLHSDWPISPVLCSLVVILLSPYQAPAQFSSASFNWFSHNCIVRPPVLVTSRGRNVRKVPFTCGPSIQCYQKHTPLKCSMIGGSMSSVHNMQSIQIRLHPFAVQYTPLWAKTTKFINGGKSTQNCTWLWITSTGRQNALCISQETYLEMSSLNGCI